MFLGFTDYKIERIEKTANRRGARVLAFGSGKIQKSEDVPYSILFFDVYGLLHNIFPWKKQHLVFIFFIFRKRLCDLF